MHFPKQIVKENKTLGLFLVKEKGGVNCQLPSEVVSYIYASREAQIQLIAYHLEKGVPILTCKRMFALYLSNIFFSFIRCSMIGHQKVEKHVPITPAMAPKIQYRMPISLWFVENSHLCAKTFIFKPKCTLKGNI